MTNPRNHPEHIEFLRYEPTAPSPAVKDNPHVAFRVHAGPHMQDQEIIIPPFVVASSSK